MLELLWGEACLLPSYSGSRPIWHAELGQDVAYVVVDSAGAYP